MNKFLIAILIGLIHFNVFSQNQGTLDVTFNPTDLGYGAGDGPDYSVSDIGIQSDGKIVIVGSFFTYNSYSYQKICRLNIDGKPDTTFHIGTGANNFIKTMGIQNDGKIVIAGEFTMFNGISKNRINRLNSDGSNDPSFNIGTGPNGRINSLAIQSDGKIIIAGNFTSYNGVGRNYIARINTDGTLDLTFNPGSGASSYINSIDIQPDGKIVCVGIFTVFNGISKNRLVRLHADGTLDNSFDVGIGVTGDLYDIQIQSNNSIICVGSCSSYNQNPVQNIFRVLTNGTIDPSFISTGTNYNINVVKIQNDGKIIIGGDFEQINNINRLNLARLNINGSLDTTFNSGSYLSENVKAVHIQNNGKIFVGGTFGSYEKFPNNFILLDSCGQLDTLFNIGTGVKGLVYSLQTSPNDDIFCSGNFYSYNGYKRSGFFKTDPNGVFDVVYNSGPGTNGHIMSSKIDPSGRVIIGGVFGKYNNYTSNYIARIKTNGTVDSLFQIGIGASGMVYDMGILSTNYIIVVGAFLTFDYDGFKYIARLNPYGEPNSFTMYNYDGWIRTTAIQKDNKILIGGNFTTVNGITKNRIARLDSEGVIDNSFVTGTGANKPVLKIAIQNDTKIILVGEFSTFNGISKKGIVRIDTTGTIDNTFNIGTGADSTINSIFIQPDNKILIGGAFKYFNGTYSPFLVRLNSDGSIDPTFNTGSGPNDQVRAIAMQSDGKIIIGGHFTTYDGIGKNRLARLNSNPYIEITAINDSILCEGDTLIVQFSSPIVFNALNSFHIQLIYNNGVTDTTITLQSIGNNLTNMVRSIIPSGLSVGNFYKIKVKATNPSLVSSFYSENLTINQKPIPPIISLQGDHLHSNIQEGNQWFNQNVPIIGENNQNFTPLINGVYFDAVIQSGCMSNKSNPITVNNVFIRTQDENKWVKVYPNPFIDKITIEISNVNQDCIINLYTILGEKIYEKRVTTTLEMDLSEFSSDMLILEIINDNKTEYFKLIKSDK